LVKGNPGKVAFIIFIYLYLQEITMSGSKILILIFLIGFILFSSCEKKRTPISYELPKNYVGWATVKYEKPNAPPLEVIDGKYHIKFSPRGFAETSSKVEDGLAEDEYFWMDGDKKVNLPQYTDKNTSMIHGDSYSTIGFQNLVKVDTLPIGKEVTLFDGGRVTKLDDKGGVSFKSGRFLLYHFYVSQLPQDVDTFANKYMPPLPPEHEIW
jgi:hypothetical protein